MEIRIVPFNLYNAIQKLDKGAKHITKVGDWGIKSFLKKTVSMRSTGGWVAKTFQVLPGM